MAIPHQLQEQVHPVFGAMEREYPSADELIAKQNRTAQDLINAQKGEKKATPTLCPFGCEEHSEGVNPHGYCWHLVGWSDDGRTYERRERVVNTSDESMSQKRYPILETDKVVSVKSGLRVYRKDAKAPLLVAARISERVAVEEPDKDLEEAVS